MQIAIVIPALDEEATVGAVVHEMLAAVRALGHGARCVVCDNGSRDRTAAVAAEAGADVVVEPARGYGAACLRALASLPALTAQQGDVDAVLFCDADGADDPADVPALLAPLDVDAPARVDMVIGSRERGARAGLVEQGALTGPQRFGNLLASTILRGAYGARGTTDLGPFRAVRKRSLDALAMDDRSFGWTVQMQARAARRGLVVVEVPVRWRRRRAGRSKVSGDVRASVQAGAIILSTLWRERGTVCGTLAPWKR